MDNGYLHMRDRARAMRRQMTSAELRLWNRIRNRQCGGLRFLRQYVVGQYILDFYCPALRLAIEVDGGIHQRADIAIRDSFRQEGLEADRGIAFLRLTNEDVSVLTTQELHARILSVAQPNARTLNPSLAEG